MPLMCATMLPVIFFCLGGIVLVPRATSCYGNSVCECVHGHTHKVTDEISFLLLLMYQTRNVANMKNLNMKSVG